jgi:hypothetical protein
MGAQPPRFTGLVREGWRSENGLHHPAAGAELEPNHAAVPASLPQPRSRDAGSVVASLERGTAALSDTGAVSASEGVRDRAGAEQPSAQPSIIDQPFAARCFRGRLFIVRFAIWFPIVATYFRHSTRAKVPKRILPRRRVCADEEHDSRAALIA